jgi:hypothetical protein
MQARYLAELVLQTVLAELATDRGPTYVKQARLSPLKGCDADQPTASCCDGAGPSDACFVFSRAQLEGIAGSLLIPSASPLPGSLGWADIDWDCKVDLTDPAPAMPPPAGYDLTSAGALNVEPVMVTLTATCALWPRPSLPADQDAVVAATAVQEMLSAHVIINNVPKL